MRSSPRETQTLRYHLSISPAALVRLVIRTINSAASGKQIQYQEWRATNPIPTKVKQRTKPRGSTKSMATGLRRLDLPVVDLASSDLRAAAKSIRQACVEYGFFYVINHGIDAALLERVFTESRKFFELPMKEKMALRKNSSHRGYTAPYSEKVDPLPESPGDCKESFYIGPLGDGDLQPDVNQWPSGERFLSWKKIMQSYHANALSIIVNIGDLLERWTNCVFRSTLHRVVPIGKERYSIAFFIDPSPNLLVQCMESCCSEANPPRFPPIKSGDYLEERLSSTYKLATV
ncbi:hypothetical protein PR202_gb22527 [Eleusine coracana subsp. coracana]|uniref:Fe2OG dioxygenase domain-containing protein n=1 Tax=Eleusine coracana subsp. coracana TaxID=191504 RepID=A0AAV5FGI9_ELECO|nr:hypothetical protein PR202_gb22527 [Eleusine coracana subsp. coracana]